MLPLFRQTLPRAAVRAFSTTAARPLAKMQIIGRLADSPELFDTASGKQIVRYVLGVSSGPRDENGNRNTSWFRVAGFMQEGPGRDLLLSLPKGTQLYVEADARMDSYETEEGQKRTTLNLLQRSFHALSSKPRDASPEGSE